MKSIITKTDVEYGNLLPYSFCMITDLFAKDKRKYTTSFSLYRMFESNKKVIDKKRF